MAKPSTAPTWATDANFSSGPSTGNPTKVDPPGWPAATQGLVPGDGLAAELVNKIFNAIFDWIGWVNDGSSAGAADAHIVETDASGHTTLRRITFTGDDAGLVYRSTGTIADAVAASIDALSRDTWTCATPTAENTVTLLDATATTALVNGMRTTVKRGGDGAFAINIRRESAGALEYMAILTASQHTSATFQVEGGRWVLHSFSPNCTADADAGP